MAAPGNDMLLFATAAEGGDVIIDFTPGADRIGIVDSGFGGGLTAETDLLATGRFATSLSGTATQAGGQLIYETDAGRPWWDADGTDPGAPVSLARLTGAPALGVSDILLL